MSYYDPQIESLHANGLLAKYYFNGKTLRGDASQNAPGGNSRHTTCKTPQEVVAAKGYTHFVTVNEFSP